MESKSGVSHLKLCKGKRVYNKGDIPPGNIGSQFAGQQPGVGAGDVDVRMKFYPQGVDCLLPALHLLNLIEEQVELFLAISDFLTYIVMKGVIFAQVLVSQILKVQKDGIRAAYLITNLLQQNAFATAPDAGQYLDDVLPIKRRIFAK